MPAVSLACQVALAAVLAVSGVAKLRDRDGVRAAVGALGVPARLVTVVALGLAPVELVVAGALLWPSTGRWAAFAAGALLLAFTAVVAANLVRGTRPPCHCFGAVGGADIGPTTLVRNGVLIAAAVGAAGVVEPWTGFAADRPGSAAVAATVGVLAASGLLAAESALDRRERDRDAAPDAGATTALDGTPLPDLRLPVVDPGGDVSLRDLVGSRPLLLVFLLPGCGPCVDLLPSVRRWVEDFCDRLRVVVVVSGDSREAARRLLPAWDETVLLDPGGTARLRLGRLGNPAGVLVGSDGRVRGEPGRASAGVRCRLADGLGVPAPVAEDAPGNPVEVTGRHRVEPAPAVTVEVTGPDQRPVTVLVDETTGVGVSLDPVGSLVWSHVQDGGLLEDLVASLAAETGADVDRVRGDVHALVADLREKRLVTLTRETAAATR